MTRPGSRIPLRRMKHGHTRRAEYGDGSPTYRSWFSMRQRCQSPKHKSFRNYGGRGIRVCERWQRFENFLADMGERPPGTSLDRIDPDGNYEPANCRWASSRVQGLNRRTNVTLTLNGETLPIAEWARRIGVWPNAIKSRLARGWPIERALSREPWRMPRTYQTPEERRAHARERFAKRKEKAPPCAECGRTKQTITKGLCQRCYTRQRRAEGHAS